MPPITQTCAVSGQPFMIRGEDQAFYQKLGVPLPKLSPSERMRRRMLFQNVRHLYLRKCDLSGKEIVSIYSPELPLKVYHSDEWFSDKWDAADYGRDFDFSRPFFEQIAELYQVVPHIALFTSPDAKDNNTMYINYAGESRNCYMVFEGDRNQDCLYSNFIDDCRDCVDCSSISDSELCYECVDCKNSYRLIYSQDSFGCRDSAFLKNCVSCSNCFFCFNLVHKEYHIFNKAYSKEEYEDIMKHYDLGDHEVIETLKAKFIEESAQYPQKYARNKETENSLGDYLQNLKNCYYCFDTTNSEDLAYCQGVYKTRDSQDISYFGDELELSYNCLGVGIQSYQLRYCISCMVDCVDLTYCINMRLSKNCFGSVGMKNKQHCILNKQYSKEDYEALLPRIIEHMKQTGEWGEFFPASMSPFAYNESAAQSYLPLNQKEALDQGYKWVDRETKKPSYHGPTVTIPHKISEVDDVITRQILTDESSGQAYKVTPQELTFYRKIGVPVPRHCPDERHRRRMNKRAPYALWERKCDQCQQPFYTSFSPDRSEKIYCEKCYLDAVY